MTDLKYPQVVVDTLGEINNGAFVRGHQQKTVQCLQREGKDKKAKLMTTSYVCDHRKILRG